MRDAPGKRAANGPQPPRRYLFCACSPCRTASPSLREGRETRNAVPNENITRKMAGTDLTRSGETPAAALGRAVYARASVA
eukprot:scaffold14253_cov45-Phaeocystis_antarctica.AAC.1